MKFWNALTRFESGMASIGAGSCLFLMMVMTVVSVLGRYFLDTDLVPGAYNMIERILFPLLVFWALPIAHKEGTFPRLEVLSEKLAPRWRAVVGAFVVTVEIVVYAVVFYYVLKYALAGMQTQRQMQIGSSFWPVWPIFLMMPLAFGLMLIEMVRLVARDLRLVLGRGG